MRMKVLIHSMNDIKRYYHLSQLLNGKSVILFGIIPEIEECINEYLRIGFNVSLIIEFDHEKYLESISGIRTAAPSVLREINEVDSVLVMMKETEDYLNLLDEIVFVYGKQVLDRQFNTVYIRGLYNRNVQLIVTGHRKSNGGLFHNDLNTDVVTGRVGFCEVQPGEQLCYHAHIHVVPSANDLMGEITKDFLPIKMDNYNELIPSYPQVGNYLYYEDVEKNHYIFPVHKPVGRQCMRKIFAESEGKPELAS